MEGAREGMREGVPRMKMGSGRTCHRGIGLRRGL